MKDDGVAEVIGVILIVAITVVVAAIVAAFALGMGSSIKKPSQVYFTLEKSAPNNFIVITNYGGTDLALLKTVDISYTDKFGIQTDFKTPAEIINSNPGLASGDLCVQYGTSLEIDPALVMSGGQCHVVVRGTFVDGSQHVLVTGDI